MTMDKSKTRYANEEQRTIAVLERRIGELEAQLQGRDESLAARFRELALLTRKLEEQRAELDKLRVTWPPFRLFVQSRYPNPFPVPPWYRRLWRRTKKRFPQRAVNIIRQSSLFDADWYLSTYPELKKNRMARRNPALHYLKRGAFEGRNPGPDFDSNWYLARHPDVKATGVNPLLHYVLYGREEGRLPMPRR